MNMKIEKLKLEEVLKFKQMILQGDYFNNEDYVKNIELAICHWVDERYRYKHMDILESNMKLLFNELIEVFPYHGDIFRGFHVESRDEICDEHEDLKSYSSSWEVALEFTEFGEICNSLNRYSLEDKLQFRFYVAVNKDVSSLALDDLMAYIRDNTKDVKVSDALEEFISEEEKVYYGSYNEIIEYTLSDIKSQSKAKGLKYCLWDDGKINI